MNRQKKILVAAGSVAAAMMIATAALAIESHNSGRSNTSNAVNPGQIGPDVTYSYEFSMSVTPNAGSLTRGRYEDLIDDMVAEIKADLLAEYDQAPPLRPKRQMRQKAERKSN